MPSSRWISCLSLLHLWGAPWTLQLLQRSHHDLGRAALAGSHARKLAASTDCTSYLLLVQACILQSFLLDFRYQGCIATHQQLRISCERRQWPEIVRFASGLLLPICMPYSTAGESYRCYFWQLRTFKPSTCLRWWESWSLFLRQSQVFQQFGQVCFWTGHSKSQQKLAYLWSFSVAASSPH